MNTARILEETVVELIGKISKTDHNDKPYRLSEQVLWEELVACILGSRVTFETARSAFSHLRAAGYLSLGSAHLGSLNWRRNLAIELDRPLFLPKKSDGTARKYTFPYLRAKQIHSSWSAIYGNHTSLSCLLSQVQGSKGKRAILVKHACGIGPKQASLFLRNLRLAEDVAILDTHVLRYMQMHRLVKLSTKVSSSLTVYERIEEHLRRYAESLTTRLSELDIAIWITMRVFLREKRAWVS